MYTLTTTQADDLLREMIDLQAMADANEARKEYKKKFRYVIEKCFTDDDKAKFRDKAGVTVNRLTDMVFWPVLVNVILHAIGEVKRPSEGYRLGNVMNQLLTAFMHDNKCRPAQRGSGVSRGFHIHMLDGPEVTAAIRGLLTNHSTQDLGHAAYLLGRVIWYSNSTHDDADKDHHFIGDLEAYERLRSKAIPHGFVEATELVCKYSGVDYNDVAPVVGTLLERMDIDAPDLNYADAPEDIRNLVTAVMSGQAKPEVAAPVANPEPVVEAADDDGYERFDEPEPLDPSLSPAVDALIQQASSGSITGVGSYVDKFRKVNAAYHEAIAEIKRTREKLASMPIAGHTGSAYVDGSTLTYEVVMQSARNLFTDAHGRKSNKLKFDVPTLVWRDDSGNIVRHPSCPDIDHTYKFRMHHLIKYLTAKVFGQHVWMHGHTGTGKTSFVEQVEARLGFPMERLNLDSNMERADIVGAVDIVVENGAPKSVFTQGMLPKAMVQPMVFLLDEIDAGRPDMLFVLQRALENKGLTLTEDGGRLVKPHPLFMFAGTANSRGQGDEHGWYQGVRPMNLAFLNRFGAFIEVGYLDEDDEKQFLKDAYPDLNTTMADQMAAFAQMVRNSFINGELSQTISPRNLHAMAQYYMHFTAFLSHDAAWKEVVETCVSDAAPADNQQRIDELARTVFGGGL